MGKKNTILHLGGFLPCNFWEGEGGYIYIYIYWGWTCSNWTSEVELGFYYAWHLGWVLGAQKMQWT